jgi:glucose-1-phosphate cytidylyltransferase
VKVVVLCGGLGTRLREETEFRPKPLVDIGGRPILWHIMKTYAHYGFREFILCLGYRGNMIKEYFLNYEAMNNDFTICLGQKFHVHYNGSHQEQHFQVTLAETGAETMTGGRVKRVARYLDGGPFFLTYGDGVANVDVHRLLEFHKSHGRLATVTTVPPISRFGIMDINPKSEVLHFAEKPQSKEWASAGYFVLEPGVIDYIGGDECIFEREALENLASDGQLMAYRHDGFFYAMDTFREYQVLNQLWASGQAPWRVWA